MKWKTRVLGILLFMWINFFISCSLLAVISGNIKKQSVNVILENINFLIIQITQDQIKKLTGLIVLHLYTFHTLSITTILGQVVSKYDNTFITFNGTQ